MKKGGEIPGRETLEALPADFLLAVSGGVDSCALLRAVITCGLRPRVAHFDHRWRKESGDDAAFVRGLAREAGLRFYGGQATGKVIRTENAAREARWNFLIRTAKRMKLKAIVVAQHADDQVETFLLQLLRGTGSAWRGMESKSDREGVTVHRPWLGVWRKEIQAYARLEKIDWREDASNGDVTYRRNRVRRLLLPYLRKNFSPAIDVLLWRTAAVQGAEGQWLAELCRDGGEGETLVVKELRGWPVARQRRTVLAWLKRRGVAEAGFAEVEAVRGLAGAELPAKVNLAGGRFARRRMGKIFIN